MKIREYSVYLLAKLFWSAAVTNKYNNSDLIPDLQLQIGTYQSRFNDLTQNKYYIRVHYGVTLVVLRSIHRCANVVRR